MSSLHIHGQEETHRELPSYLRVYRIANFSSIGAVLLIFSILLSRALGWVGFLLPWLVVGTVYLLVTYVLDVLIFVLELHNGQEQVRRPPRPRH